MSKKSVIASVVSMAIGIGAGYGLSYVWKPGQMGGAAAPTKKILYWVAPMDPNFRKEGPGKSPMGMALIPVYAGNDSGSGAGSSGKALKINPAVVNNIGIRTAMVTRGDLAREIETVGYLSPNEDLTRDIHVRLEGWIEKLAVKSTGERIKRDQLLFQIYSPALVNAQAEYLQTLKISQKALSQAARQRLLALGMSARQIKALRRSRKAKRLVDIYAPQDGYVVKLNVREGMFIKPRTNVLRMADLKSIWVMVEIYEGQAAWVKKGQKAVMRLPFAPGRIWEGVVDYVYPTVDAKSRTVQTRLKFSNQDEQLKPNMYSEITLYGDPRKNALSVPSEAVIRTGKQERVILALGEGRFRPAKVMTGMEAGNRVEVVVGLRDGEKVVTSGQFLIDSEASLDASLLRMSAEPLRESPGAPQGAPMAEAVAKGVINSVMLDRGRVNITHEPIPDIGWPNMTMDFKVANKVDLKGWKSGQQVYFALTRKAPNIYEVTTLSRSKLEPRRMEGMSNAPDKMQMAKPSITQMAKIESSGTVNAVMAKKRMINISHGPIKVIGWPAMTMDFAVVRNINLDNVKKGDKIRFGLKKNAADQYEVTVLSPVSQRGSGAATDPASSSTATAPRGSSAGDDS